MKRRPPRHLESSGPTSRTSTHPHRRSRPGDSGRPRAHRGPSHELLPPPREQDFEPIYGFRAGIAVLEKRLPDVLRVVYTPDLRSELAELIDRASDQNIPCEAVYEGELSQRAGSDQHEGLLVHTRPRKYSPPQAIGELLVRTKGVAVAFDRVRNPYNVGAVLRTAAFFGVEAAVLGAPAPQPTLPPLAIRVAEGGTEHLALTRTTDLADTLSRFRSAGIAVVGAEDDGTPDALKLARAGKKPVVLVLGHEREGLSERVRAQCDAIVAIRGSGMVRSLNVSIAASILIADLSRSTGS